VFIHQAVDLMWMDPVTWCYPLLGPYPADFTPDYFQQAIVAELTSVTEWIFFIAILVLVLVLYRNKTLHDTLLDPDPRMQHKSRKFYRGLMGVGLFVMALAVIIIAMGDLLFR
jgi:hypothetical protein